ncbi:MAG: LacI family DNA-binding transcriptional regulator [Roseibium sp.]|uniref:LacI family DNA-binding transcriptional regulator n=1 Tax=Roseibium sp. TaxID=1936156 RepID=UPI002611AF96|nr:LacI family DNA-binding transcriptional regulator [Roseibium sp.]MCV0425354.1 LacI family DNA-binding transcriptional regulator [Roseibium sp.]
MTHRFPVKEIALQAGLSTATVDRVLNNRAHVSPQTRVRVRDAIEELSSQEGQFAAKGRRIFLDIVVEAPSRFSREIRRAVENVLHDFHPAAIRSRFAMAEIMTAKDCAAILARIKKRGSQGVCLKARDTPEVRAAIGELVAKNIPVLTIFTDIPGSQRLAYAGLNNVSAGKTAAYLMLNFLKPDDETVLTTLSQRAFQGEVDRFQAFKSELLLHRPDLKLIDASGGGGLNPRTGIDVGEKIKGQARIAGVYSMGGGNQAILKSLEESGQQPSIFIAHDLDEDNLDLLRSDRLTFVLHHDIRADMKSAIRHILAFHGLGEAPGSSESDIGVVTPMNIPKTD